MQWPVCHQTGRSATVTVYSCNGLMVPLYRAQSHALIETLAYFPAFQELSELQYHFFGPSESFFVLAQNQTLSETVKLSCRILGKTFTIYCKFWQDIRQ